MYSFCWLAGAALCFRLRSETAERAAASTAMIV